MDKVKLATAVLEQAEANLRKLVSEAAVTGDYVSVVKIAAWARTVSELVQAASDSPASIRPPRRASQARLARTKASPAQRRTPSRAANEYPQFYRQGDQLIRIAWSKKEKKEYQHKAPYSVLKVLTNAMVQMGADGRVFSTDQFLPLRDAEGAEVPSYQAYVGIALMKHVALIDQHGRQGYSVPRLAEFKDAVELVWQKLPKQ